MPQARITRQHRTAGARWPRTTGGRWSPWTLETLTSSGPSTSSATSGDRRREGRVEPLLVGLQLHPILSGISGHSAATLLGLAAAVSAAVVATRIVWEFTVPYLIRLLDRRPSQRARRIGARARLVVGWSGMGGGLAGGRVGATVADRRRPGVPHRDLIIFATFAVILVTLVLQG